MSIDTLFLRRAMLGTALLLFVGLLIIGLHSIFYALLHLPLAQRIAIVTGILSLIGFLAERVPMVTSVAGPGSSGAAQCMI
jgi:hypothetical protein